MIGRFIHRIYSWCVAFLLPGKYKTDSYLVYNYAHCFPMGSTEVVAYRDEIGNYVLEKYQHEMYGIQVDKKYVLNKSEWESLFDSVEKLFKQYPERYSFDLGKDTVCLKFTMYNSTTKKRCSGYFYNGFHLELVSKLNQLFLVTEALDSYTADNDP